VFLLRQFFLTIPIELEEAAKIDGAAPWQIFLRVILPLGAPGLSVLAILSGLRARDAPAAPGHSVPNRPR